MSRCTFGQHFRLQRNAQAAIDDNAQRIAARRITHRQQRIISQHCADANKYRVVFTPELMSEASCFRAGYPLRAAGRSRNTTVKRLRNLQSHERQLRYFRFARHTPESTAAPERAANNILVWIVSLSSEFSL